MYPAAFSGDIEEVRRLMSQMPPHMYDTPLEETNTTPLFIASQEGHVGVVSLLLSARGHVDPNRATSDGVTPLYVASQNGYHEVVRSLLVDGGADADSGLPSDGITPLWIASQNGHERVVQALLRHGRADVDKARAVGGDTPLYIASCNGHEPVVRTLLEVGGDDADKVTSDISATPLFIASQNGHEDVVRTLLTVGRADPNKARDNGATPLYIASEMGNEAVVDVLLGVGGADPRKALTAGDVTPLFVACQEGHEGVVKALLQAGRANPNKACTDDGTTPIFAASRRGHSSIVEMLLTLGRVDPNKPCTNDGATPLYVASLAGHKRVVKTLLRVGRVNPDNPHPIDGTPLFIASTRGHRDIVKTLLTVGRANPNKARTDDGATPLFIASQNGHESVVRTLLMKGHANPNQARTDNSATPIVIAVEKSHFSIARLLLAGGANVPPEWKEFMENKIGGAQNLKRLCRVAHYQRAKAIISLVVECKRPTAVAVFHQIPLQLLQYIIELAWNFLLPATLMQKNPLVRGFPSFLDCLMSDTDQERAASLSHLMRVSRVAWDYIVVPAIVEPRRLRGRRPSVDECAWAMGLAEALFPLVPRACRLVMAATVSLDGGLKALQSSRYFALMCSGVAGSPRCMEWIVRGKPTRNNARECVTLLKGLCAGGHVGMAQELVDNSSSEWKRGSFQWPANDPDVLDSLNDQKGKMPSLLHGTCNRGNLDAVKWVISTFGAALSKSGWDLVQPFQIAVQQGHVDVVKWLGSSTGAVAACLAEFKNSELGFGVNYFSASPSLEVMKCCTEWFRVSQDSASIFLDLFFVFRSTTGKNTDDFEASCQWIKDTLSIEMAPSLYNITSTEALRWVISNFPSEPPTSNTLTRACCTIADVELVEWLLANYPSVGPITPETFVKTCENRKDSVLVLKFLLQTTPPGFLTPENHKQCLEHALSFNNVTIAEWLERTFHVMDYVNSIPSLVDSCFRFICAENNSGVGGIEWFLSHLTIHSINEKSVHKAVGNCFTQFKAQKALFLLKAFNIPICPKNKGAALNWIVSHATLSEAKHLVSLGEFSSQDIMEGLRLFRFCHSGKVVKWLIQQFNLDRQARALLLCLVRSNKRNSAKWLISKFHVTLEECVAMTSTACASEVATWKMLLDVYPEITDSFAKDHLREWVVASPHHLKVTMKKLGLKRDDILVTKWWGSYE
ncbi:Ankyrin repeat protein [Pelomyxa schiedti]|nr:Ankyrin repeat protein [Pelomyxa schiedti]